MGSIKAHGGLDEVAWGDGGGALESAADVDGAGKEKDVLLGR